MKSCKQEKSENKLLITLVAFCNDIMLAAFLSQSAFRKVSHLCDLLQFYCIAFRYMNCTRELCGDTFMYTYIFFNIAPCAKLIRRIFFTLRKKGSVLVHIERAGNVEYLHEL
jgi:hypothetical protein